MSEIPTEITCACGSLAPIHDTCVEKNGEVYEGLYRCLYCGADTFYKPMSPEMQEDLMGLAVHFKGDGG